MQIEADLLIVGGGIHGCGIARDAAGRGLRVVLVERADLASGTSSASSKMIHGGLRYLEQLELRLVHEALAEREILLRAAPHLVQPLRFIMPHVPALRPAWMVRTGLLLYDWLARRHTLPASEALDFRDARFVGVLKPAYRRGFAYSDCRVDDSRLVVVNALAAAELGARIFTRTRCADVMRERRIWRAHLTAADGRPFEVTARALVNATGPWARRFLTDALGISTGPGLKLVQGSHIVVPRLCRGEDAFILQNDDRRVVFVCPFGAHSLIGTTDIALDGEPADCHASPAEIEYLCAAASRYFAREAGPSEVLWSYCGVRGLVDDGASNPSRVTRDYTLHLDAGPGGAPVLTVFGGKLTTYRRLAERALHRLAPHLPAMGEAWTARAALPGGDGDAGDAAKAGRYAALPASLIAALRSRHGSRVSQVLGDAASTADLGEAFGAGLYAREVDYMIDREWARAAEDVLWRRTKAGLDLSPAQRSRIEEYVTRRVATL